MNGSRTLCLLSAAVIGLIAVVAAQACNVPVFRYALERWRPDLYEVVVFHDRPLSADHMRLVNQLQTAASDPSAGVNVTAMTADIAQLPDAWLRELWASQQNNALPRAVVLAPWKGKKGAVIWAGPPAELRLDALSKSPARSRLIERLAAGDSLVWFVLKSTDDARNRPV